MWTVSPPFLRFKTSQEYISRLTTYSYDYCLTFDTVTLFNTQRFNAVTFAVTLQSAVTRIRSYCNG